MKAEKFIEFNKAKGLALLSAATIAILYITKNLFLASEILMVFLGITALIRVKVEGIELSKKKTELKKGIYFSLAGLVFGFGIEKIFGVNFFVELILFVLVLAVLKEIYSSEKEKWVNAFLLMGSILLSSGIVLLIKSVLMELI